MSPGRSHEAPHKAPPDARRRWLPGCVLVAAGVLGSTAVVTACGAPAAPSTAATGTRTPASTAAVAAPGTTVFPVAHRTMVPAVSGRTLSGGSLALRDLTGSDVVVVNVWASWCAPCREEAGVLTTGAAQMQAQHVRFVGVDEADSPSAAKRFVQQSGVTYPQLADPDGAILARLTLLPASGIPSTLVLDRRGHMAARVIGPLTATSLQQVVAAAQEDA